MISNSSHDEKQTKFYAFVQLKSALLSERYEECSKWITQALSHRAKKKDVLQIIRNPCLNLEDMFI